ncbi:MAG: DNA polymerase-3 subunit alpha [Saprospiraceae bacterium]|jgi:DNA polymerase-3 subunit alpha
MPDFCHLHCHTHYSLLDGASDIGRLMDKAVADGQKGIALTDHGNMFGAFHFVNEANKRGLKGIVGCEFYLVEDRHKQSFAKAKGEKDRRYHQLLLAKDQNGYQNLAKLCSLGFIEGLYGKFPRIDKELLVQYSEGLIATSCCLAAEIPRAIAKGDMAGAEESLKWWIELFGDDYYIELMRHKGLDNLDNTGVSQEYINQELIKLAKKYDRKVICTNDAHYVEEEDWKPHDVILCVNTGRKLDEIDRFKFSSSDYYFKKKAEMQALFHEIPEALENTMEIFHKIESPTLARDILLPNFPLPEGFTTQSDYLKHLVFEGAKKKYGEMTSKLKERLDFELGIIKDMGFDGYFLIVQDFIDAARELGVAVGPGRGSAAGSAVAYSLRITNVDPIKYNLLFERFLNPERVSMPDIDIDFDDDGRQKVIDWVVDKYGKNQVAQIITFGTMAAKSSIKDVARVMNYPLSETDKISRLVPTRPGTKLRKIFGKTDKELRADWQGDDYSNIQDLLKISRGNDTAAEIVALAQRVEGTVRNTGIHAAGLIIAPDDITKYIPVSTSKDSDLLITQFDGSVVEDAGMLKMDFLGLKTLSIIKDAIENIVLRHGEEKRIDPDEIPLDDTLTYELFQRGDMIGIFQFESEGMRKFLKELKPTNIEDLIAMNALYRPGPMDNIPSFIARKHGTEEIVYPHVWLTDILKPTNGIMVYQEQIMQTAQIMADYSLGKADMLRRAMGKKKLSEMERHRKIFTDGAVAKGVDPENAGEIFDTMEKFASYGFNRSHAAAYSIVAFQTAYLKAHYPAEFMASVLTHNKSDITKLNFFLRESKRVGIPVLGPDINESMLNFTVNKDGAIRFGLSALKGVGEGPVTEIVRVREESGVYTNLWDMTKRLSLRAVNKKCLESLAEGGALDDFNEGNRAQYFAPNDNYDTVIEHAVRFGNAFQSQKESMANSLFGDMTNEILPDPKMPNVKPWNKIEMLNREKRVTGIFISGHPLDDYHMELTNFVDVPLDKAEERKETLLHLAGLVTEVFHGTNQKGIGYCKFTLQDFRGSMQFFLSNDQYKHYGKLVDMGEVLFVEGTYNKSYSGDNYYFRIKEIKMLDTVGKSLTKSITIQIPIRDLTQEMVTELSSLPVEGGKHKYKVYVVDPIKQVNLELIGNDARINVETGLIDHLSRLGLSYRLN